MILQHHLATHSWPETPTGRHNAALSVSVGITLAGKPPKPPSSARWLERYPSQFHATLVTGYDGGATVFRGVGMKDLQTVIGELRRLQPELRTRYPIREMGVFGSWVRGEQTDDSDLDVLVDLDDGITLIDFVGLQLALADALGMRVDLVMKEGLKPRIGERILSEVVRV
jgi:predicted nucleotidyltransferase